jgi:3',5'-cyclic AMP phosphodiesterase CpdA
MKIRVLSDLHLECDMPSRVPAAPADLVILAGDIDNQARGVGWASEMFADKSVDSSGWPPVVYVPGNHEYYEGTIEVLENAMADAARQTPNVHFLNNRVLFDPKGNWRVLGTTLWTDFKLFGNEPKQFDAICLAAGAQMNDFNGKIRVAEPEGDGSTGGVRSAGKPGSAKKAGNAGISGTRAFTVADSIEMNRNAQRWLGAELRKPFNGKTIVVSHHAPHRLSLAPRYAADPVSAGFVNDMTEWFNLPIDLWVHGHTHTGFDYRVNNTRVVCNPRGYPQRLRYGELGPENPDFAWDFLVEV